MEKRGLLSNAFYVAQFWREETHQRLEETQTILSIRPVHALPIGYSFDRVIDYTLTLESSGRLGPKVFIRVSSFSASSASSCFIAPCATNSAFSFPY